MKTMKPYSDWHNIAFCACVCASAHICTSLISLGKCSLAPAGSSLADAFAWWDCWDVSVCVEEVGCNRGECKQSLVLSSSLFPLSLTTSCVCCVPVHLSVFVCHRLWVKSRSFPEQHCLAHGHLWCEILVHFAYVSLDHNGVKGQQ